MKLLLELYVHVAKGLTFSCWKVDIKTQNHCYVNWCNLRKHSGNVNNLCSKVTLLNTTVIMFAGFCYDSKSVEGPRRIIMGQLSSRRFKGEWRRTFTGWWSERTRSHGRKTSTYELNYIRQSWRPITYSVRVTRDSNPD